MTQFINLSNHPSTRWSGEQLTAANGEIIDIPFPNVPADATEEQCASIVSDTIKQVFHALGKNVPFKDKNILHVNFLDGITILVQGEAMVQTLLATTLKALHADVVCATSERVVTESMDASGSTVKNVTFKFVQFRRYVIPSNPLERWM